jgi:hypothetical protein
LRCYCVRSTRNGRFLAISKNSNRSRLGLEKSLLSDYRWLPMCFSAGLLQIHHS